MAGLLLQAVDVTDQWRWRWLLTDEHTGATVAEHTVAMDPASSEAEAFADLYWHLRWHADPYRRAESEASIVDRVGAWAGTHILGPAIGAALGAATPVTVRVTGPDFLLSLPLELSHVDGQPLAQRGDIAFVFDVGGSGPRRAAPPTDRLRMVAVFSLPTEATSLGLRRERYELARFVRGLAASSRRMVQLEILQYGVTRQSLAKRMEAGGGPDILHLSGHGRSGAILLERSDGNPDPVNTDELLGLLRPARNRLRLAVLSACESAATTTAETLRWLNLEEAAAQAQDVADAEAGVAPTAGMARLIAEQLGCAVVAMRYSVLDEFAIDLASSLYEGLFALDLTVDEALRRAVPPAAAAFPGLSLATPALVGAAAVDMRLTPPAGKPNLDPAETRMAAFPAEPVRFVGRAGVMARASRALAPDSGQSAVLFHGMAGAGKTSCALELAYRHQDRYAVPVWWQGPLRDEEWPQALTNLALAWEAQLSDYGFAMVDKIGTPSQFERFLPRLTELLEQNGLLLVLDNLETLLTPTGQWRDPRWAPFVEALTTAGGESRVALTSRVRPAELSPAIQVEQVHALSRDESVLMARELPNLRNLLLAEPGPKREPVDANRATVRRVLHLVQGHPKLLELADAAAADPGTLAAHLADADDATLTDFFAHGESTLDATGFLRTLASWTRTTMETLPAEAQELLQVLAGMEEDDRHSDVLEATWPHLTNALPALTTAALIDPQPAGELVRFRIHPGIAETVRAITPTATREAIDTQLGTFWAAVAVQAIEREGGEHTSTIVHAGLAAAPYLLRQHKWDTAAYVIGNATYRDDTVAVAQLAVAHLRGIAEATDTPGNLAALGRAAARIDPAEGQRLLHTALERATTAGDHGLASGISGDLVNLYRSSGRLAEALVLVDRMAELTRQAGLGPWTQLAGQGWRLQILYRMGQNERVLTEIHRLIEDMIQLPDPPGDNETVPIWVVREAILNLGSIAAKNLQRWQQALDFNAQNLASMRARGAGDYAMAFHRFNDYVPLLRLGRLDEAEQLLLACQQVYEDHNDIPSVAKTLTARADLADKRGHRINAIALEHTALRYGYTRPDPHSIGVSHYALATYLGRAYSQIAHRIAAATIYQLTGHATELARSVRALAQDMGHLTPPGTIAEVVAIVEQVEGVRFSELVVVLANGDLDKAQQALNTVLHMARTMPADEVFDLQQHLDNWGSVLSLLVDAANGDADAAAAITETLDGLSTSADWSALAAVLRRVLGGERDAELLSAGLDPIDTAIVERALDALAGRITLRPPSGGDE